MDGGYISVSYDYGETWYNIINDESWNYEIYPNSWDGANINLYNEDDVLYNGENGFSGNSEDWITTEFGWYYMPVNPPGFTTMLEDTTIIRFNFISDSVETNKEGWMIDHIRLISYLLMGSVDDYQKVDFSISPNPIRESAQ